jgi:UDP-N-acetyl-D-galactosamine dehydrogenase
VPTPVDDAHQPDLTPVISASETVGKAIKSGDIVVYESTVYPGVTEEVCVPVLEKVSGLKCGADFTVGYSPERINPGDREHTFTKIKKVVSGFDAQDALHRRRNLFFCRYLAGVHCATSIKVGRSRKSYREHTTRSQHRVDERTGNYL